MIATVAVLTFALLYVWRELPTGPIATQPPAPVPTIPAAPAIPTDTVDCGLNGHWNGSACLCGGIAGWSCPADQTCEDYGPTPTTPDAMGTCEPQAGPPLGQLDIEFDKDLSNELLTSPFEVSGSVALPNALAQWQLKDANGVPLESGMVQSDDEGKFTLRSFILTVPKTSTGTLEIGHSEIPVRLPSQAMTVTGYYLPGPASSDRESIIDCGDVRPVEKTVVRSSLPIETALRSLLVPTATPSAIPIGTRLESIKVSGGTATVIFSPEFENYGGGSCNVQAIRAQIEQTLKQFSSVKNVVISVVGKTAAETLQP